jgi:SAM-dependent methyltransferase
MKKRYRIVRDNRFGFDRIQPTPSQEEVERYYNQEFYALQNPRFNDSSLAVQKEEKEFFDSRWDAINERCRDYFGSRKKLKMFDIGCGYAQGLLYFKKRGFQVSGLEPTQEGVKYAISRGLKVYHSGIEDYSCVKGDKFDIVMLINVLEHLRDPVRTLAKIRKDLLKLGGMLVIDVPNEFNDFQVVADVEYKLKQWWVCPPNHLNYFSADTIKQLLTKVGYRIYDYEASFPIELFLLFGENYRQNPELGKQCHKKRVKFEYLMKKHGKSGKLKAFYKAMADLNLGRQIVIYAISKK